MAATTSTSPTTSTNCKRIIKRKLDESVLKKARAALGLPLDHQDDEPTDQPSLKWRKPRHNTAEGQKYVKNKEKRRKLEQDAETISSTTTKSRKKQNTAAVEADSKKKKKRKKKKKGKISTNPAESIKSPDSDKRHEMSAISYLQLWSTNRDHWKFEKLKQMWLLKNSLNSGLINDNHFEILLEYIGTMKGAARKATLEEMESVVTKYSIGGESNSADEGKQNDSKLTEIMYERARQIIQMLTDD